MKKIAILYLYFFVILSYAQNDFRPNSFLIEGKIIPLYTSSSGSKIMIKLNNLNSDYYYEVKIIKKRGDRLYVKTNSIEDNKKASGWINPKYVGVGLKNGLSLNTIPIYKYPNYQSNKENISIHIESIIAKVVDLDGQWLKVYFYNDGIKVMGWLSPKNQCYNLYTMCTAE